MLSILTAILLAAAPEPAPLALPASEAAAALARELPTGSLLFSQGDCLAVRMYTISPYTHVATVVEREGERFVYESTGGAGVRKQTLGAYFASQKEATVYLYVPAQPLSPEQCTRIEQHLESQLGRPYAIRHHLTGARCDGLHCAEYVADALIAADLLKPDQPSRISPASLLTEIEQSGLYLHAATLQLERAGETAPTDTGWCGRMWFETKECSQTCYRRLRGWFCCK
jgi:hypothetical protein